MMKEFVAGGTAEPGITHQAETNVDGDTSTRGLACQAAAAPGDREHRAGQTGPDALALPDQEGRNGPANSAPMNRSRISFAAHTLCLD